MTLKLIFLDSAMKEDFEGGDPTSDLFETDNSDIEAFLVAKEFMIISGLPIAEKILKKCDSNLNLEVFIEDGKPANKGDNIAKISGSFLSIILIERTVLNFMQKLCGIATQTHTYALEIEGTNVSAYEKFGVAKFG